VSSTKGILYVIATPIGNLHDFSPRACRLLQEVHLIVAEDTRHSRYLLAHFNISTPLQALHQHNERHAIELLLPRLLRGDNIALISDAGTPLISDPGRLLVEAAHLQHITVIPIPGPCALISALSVAGLNTDQFVFEGFLPSKHLARQKRLEELKPETRTLIFYEAPHRLLECLQDMLTSFGDQRILVLAKELTKIFETVYRGPIIEVINWLTTLPERQKGEFVLVVKGAEPVEIESLSSEVQHIFKTLQQELPLKQAARLTSQLTGVSKNKLYALGLEQQP